MVIKSKKVENRLDEGVKVEHEKIKTSFGIKHRKDINVPMFSALCFVCKDGGSANILVNYLQNNMGFSLTRKEYSWYSLTSKNNEQIHVWTLEDFEEMRGYQYQAIFIQNNIYDHVLADKESVHASYVNELIPPMEPWVFRLPNPMKSVQTKPLPTKIMFEK